MCIYRRSTDFSLVALELVRRNFAYSSKLGAATVVGGELYIGVSVADGIISAVLYGPPSYEKTE